MAITVVNRSSDHASIHWHGIELESYPDGVPGWSGSGNGHHARRSRPGDSLTVRFTPPRAGTFMYHSHFNEAKQISVGPVRRRSSSSSREQKFDPATAIALLRRDRIVGERRSSVRSRSFLMNGQAQPKPMDLKAGTTLPLPVSQPRGRWAARHRPELGQAPVDVERRRQGRRHVSRRHRRRCGRPADVRSRRDLRLRVHAERAGRSGADLRPAAPAARSSAAAGALPPPPPTIMVPVLVR